MIILLPVIELNKRLDLEEFFNTINLRIDQLIQIKKRILQLLRELVENKIIQNEVKIILKSGKKRIALQVGDQIYTIKNSSSQSADELQFVLVEKVYDSIRESNTDICDSASNLGFKADNIKNVKDHIFYNEYDLGLDQIERK